MSKKSVTLIAFILISIMLFGAEKYAVLITGDYADERGNFEGSWAIANGNNRTRRSMEEFWNDTFLEWEMLINKGYSNENIFVLFANGVDFQPQYIIDDGRYMVPENYAPMTDYSATKENVEMVLQGFANGNQEEGIPQLQSDDFLIIWTSDHGVNGLDEFDNNNFHRALCLLGYDVYYHSPPIGYIDPYHSIKDYEMQNLLAQINCQKKVIFMQQCFSGGFVPYLENENSIVFTATDFLYSAFDVDTRYYYYIDYSYTPPQTDVKNDFF